MGDTKIEWATKVWNPTTGCSNGCSYCYARRIAMRRMAPEWKGDRQFSEVRCHLERLDAPRKWKKKQVVFVDSMSDLFDDGVSKEFRAQVFHVIRECPQHKFLVLTKQYNARLEDVPVLDNLWMGVSCVAAFSVLAGSSSVRSYRGNRFVSLEPLMGPVASTLRFNVQNRAFSWVVVGAMTGPGAWQCSETWLRDVVVECRNANVPVFVKQIDAKKTPMDKWPAELRVRQFPWKT